MPIRLRNSFFAAVPAGLALVLAACSNQAEGERCSTQGDSDECASGLVCTAANRLPNVKADPTRSSADGRCCPADPSQATELACQLSAAPPGADAAPPPGDATTLDATDDGAADAGTTDGAADDGAADTGATDATDGATDGAADAG